MITTTNPFRTGFCTRATNPGTTTLRPLLLLAGMAFGFGLSALATDRIEELDDLNGKRLGIMVGTMVDLAMENRLDYTNFSYYESLELMVEALYAGDIDAIIYDEPSSRIYAASNPRLRILNEIVFCGFYGFAVSPDSPQLREQFSKVIAEGKQNGLLERLAAKWVTGPEEGKVLPKMDAADGNLPVLRLGVMPELPPFVYRNDTGNIQGFDVELAGVMAKSVGRRLEVVPMEFSSLLPALRKKEVDVIASCITITEERQRHVSFTDGYYPGGIVAIVLDTPPGSDT